MLRAGAELPQSSPSPQAVPLQLPNGQAGVPPPAKVIYIRTGNVTVSPVFAAALARCAFPDLLQPLLQQGVHTLEHFREEAYYAAFAEGRRFTPVAPIEDDDGGMSAQLVSSMQPRTRRAPTKPKQFKLAESFRWGCVSFLGKPSKHPKKPDYIQCTCPRRSHRMVNKHGTITQCTVTMPYSGPEEKDRVIRQLKHWVSQCNVYPNRRQHQKYLAPECDWGLDPETGRLPSDREATDDEGLARPKKRLKYVGGRGGARASSSSAAVMPARDSPAMSSDSSSSSSSDSDSTSMG
jgi:hypothetical protein